jgi:uncharacterized protein
MLAMNLSSSNSLTEDELERLDEILVRCTDGRAMELEVIDGFFSALLTGPEMVMPSEYLPLVFGDSKSASCKFGSLEEGNEALGLLMRHWNSIAGALASEDGFVPLLLEDENGNFQGNDWAEGFLTGVSLRPDAWEELLSEEEDNIGLLLPVMILAHEHDEDPELRSPPIPPEKREEIIVAMAAGVMIAYMYFREGWTPEAHAVHTPERAGSKAKVSRNDPCPCGSGKKFKRYCGA